MKLRSTPIFAIVAFTLLYPASAHAGAPHVPCRYPFVFSDAAVNLVVLPYDDTGVSQPGSRGSGTQLALLLQMDALSHILGYGSVGAVQLEASPGDQHGCETDTVAGKLLGKEPGAEAQIRPGNGLVLVWGLMYEEDDDLYIQTYARFLRRDATEDLLFPAGEYKLVAKPTSQMITFAPRHLSKKDLDKIEAAYLQANVLRQWQSDAAPGEELHGIAKCGGCEPDSRPVGFLVIRRAGDWIQIRRRLPNGEVQDGWIHANSGNKQFDLDRQLPELSFLEGTVGYLHSRVEADNKREPSEEIGRLAEEQFATFDRFSDRDNETVAIAVAHQLAGITKMLSSRNYLEGLAQAQDSFDHARRLVPYSADAITLAAASELNRATVSRSAGEPVTIENPRLVAQQFAQASALAPASKDAMTNLSSYYRVALDAKYKGDAKNTLDKGYVEQQLHEIEKRKPTVLERAPARGAPASTAPDRPRVDVLDLKKVAIPALPKARREILVQPPTRSATTSSTEIARATPRPTPPPVRPEPGTSLPGTKTSRVQIVAAYNLPKINGKVTFTPDLLAGILLGDIRAWNDPAVRILNPGIELPAIPIVVVPPSNDPQLSAALDDYLARSPIWKKRSQAPGETQMEARAGRVERGTRNEWVSPSNGSLFIVSLEQTATNKSLQFTVLR